MGTQPRTTPQQFRRWPTWPTWPKTEGGQQFPHHDAPPNPKLAARNPISSAQRAFPEPSPSRPSPGRLKRCVSTNPKRAPRSNTPPNGNPPPQTSSTPPQPVYHSGMRRPKSIFRRPPRTGKSHPAKKRCPSRLRPKSRSAIAITPCQTAAPSQKPATSINGATHTPTRKDQSDSPQILAGTALAHARRVGVFPKKERPRTASPHKPESQQLFAWCDASANPEGDCAKYV
jgi:hypothetical protein